MQARPPHSGLSAACSLIADDSRAGAEPVAVHGGGLDEQRRDGTWWPGYSERREQSTSGALPPLLIHLSRTVPATIVRGSKLLRMNGVTLHHKTPS